MKTAPKRLKSFVFITKLFSFGRRQGLSVRQHDSHFKLSPDYWFLGQDARIFSGTRRVIDEKYVAGGYGGRVFSVRGSLTERKATDNTLTKTTSLIGSLQQENGARWFLTFDKVHGRGVSKDYQAALGFVFPLGKNSSQRFETRIVQTSQGRGGEIDWAKTQMERFGWSARASAFSLPSRERDVDGFYEKTTSAGNILLSGVYSNERKNAMATWSGSVVRADRNWFLSTPQQGPRILVKASEPEVRALYENREEGKLGTKGLLLSNVAPYAPTKVSLDPLTLSLEADTSDINRTIVTPRYGVAQVVFDTTADGQLEGVLLFNGEPMNFGVLEFEGGQTGWVGETGRLWIQGFSKPGVDNC